MIIYGFISNGQSIAHQNKQWLIMMPITHDSWLRSQKWCNAIVLSPWCRDVVSTCDDLSLVFSNPVPAWSAPFVCAWNWGHLWSRLPLLGARSKEHQGARGTWQRSPAAAPHGRPLTGWGLQGFVHVGVRGLVAVRGPSVRASNFNATTERSPKSSVNMGFWSNCNLKGIPTTRATMANYYG